MSTEQFPDDEIDGRSRIIIYIWSAFLETSAGPQLVDRVTGLMRKTIARLDGFVEGAVFESDDGKGVTAIVRWKTRHAWAQAEWEFEVNKLKADLAQAGIRTTEGMYYEHARVAPNPAGA